MRALALSCVLLAGVACSEPEPEPPGEEVTLEQGERMAGPPAPTEGTLPPVEALVEPEAVPEPATDQRVTVAAPPDAQAHPLAVGQWARYGLTWRDGGRSRMDYRLVGMSGHDYVLEIEDRRDGNRKIFSLVVDFGDRSSVEVIQVRSLRVMHQSRVEDVPDRMVQVYQPILQAFLALLVLDWADSPQEDVEVPAGTFAQAYKHERSMAFGESRVVADVWYHPEVPLTNLVRFASQDGSQRWELIGYGTDARALVPDAPPEGEGGRDEHIH